MVAGFSIGTALVAPTERSQALCTIKSDFLNVIHQADITVNGKSIKSTQPFIIIARHFQLISEMSENDLKPLGHSIVFAPTLDNPKATNFCKSQTFANTASTSGNGLSNNRVFANTSDNQTAAGTQNTSFSNAGNQYKIGRYVDIANTAGSGVCGATGLMTSVQLNAEFRPYYQISGNYMYWHDYAVIKLNYLFESLNKIGLVKRLDAQLRLWVNTGTVNVNVTGPNATNTGYNLAPSDNTFSNTCPLMVNYHNGGAGAGIVPATTAKIVAGLYIKQPPTTTCFAGINLAANVLAHPLPNLSFILFSSNSRTSKIN
jgi:hypothetical protein